MKIFKKQRESIWRQYNTRCAQDPEVPEAVKQFEALVSDGAGERYAYNKYPG